jgi:hypothetical protein
MSPDFGHVDGDGEDWTADVNTYLTHEPSLLVTDTFHCVQTHSD